MSINGISSSSVYQSNSAQSYYSKFDQIKGAFQKLGQDLQSGNLSQAQQDFTSLFQSISPQPNTNSRASQAFATLGQDLQSGNLSGAQQDYTKLLQGLQSGAGQVHRHHHHHHHVGSNGEQNSAISQAFATLGQDVQSGDLASAQQAYSTIQNYLQNLGYNSSSSSSSSSAALSSGSTVNVTV